MFRITHDTEKDYWFIHKSFCGLWVKFKSYVMFGDQPLIHVYEKMLNKKLWRHSDSILYEFSRDMNQTEVSFYKTAEEFKQEHIEEFI